MMKIRPITNFWMPVMVVFPNELHNHIFATFDFNYYTKIGNPSRPRVECCSPDFTLDESQQTDEEECVADFSPSCPNPPCLQEEEEIYASSLGTIADRNRLLRFYLHWNNDTMVTQNVLNLLDTRTEQVDYQLSVSGLIGEGQFTQAADKIATISATDPEATDFLAYNHVWIEAGLQGADRSMLPKEAIDSLISFRTGNTSVKDQANTVDYYYNGIYTPLIPIAEDHTSFFRVEKPTDTSRKLQVYPNPSNHTIYFEWKKEAISRIEITNLLGQRVWLYQSKDDVDKVRWMPEQLKSGTYFYGIETSSGQSEQGKILYLR